MTPPRRVDLAGPDFTRLLATTRQPNLAPGPGDDWALMPPAPPPQPPKQNAEPTSFPMMDVVEWRQLQGQLGAAAEPEASEIGGSKLKVYDGYGDVREERE